MADEAGEESGGEKSMDNSIKINEVPAGIEEGKGKEVSQGLPEDHPGQNQDKNIARYGPVKKYLPGVVFPGQGISFGNSQKVLEDGKNSLNFRSVDDHGIRLSGDKGLMDDMSRDSRKEKGDPPAVPEEPFGRGSFQGQNMPGLINHPSGDQEDENCRRIGPMINSLKEIVPLNFFITGGRN